MIILDNVFIRAIEYSLDKYDVIWLAARQQVWLVFVASVFTCVLGVSLAVVSRRVTWLRQPVLKVANTLYTVPILALFGLLISFLGIGKVPAMIALVIYGILPVLNNTYEGIADINPALREAAQGMGASNWQILIWVELPLALPKIIAGIRTSVVMNISVATFAVFIGAGGLGTIIVQGMRTFHEGMLIAGTLVVALIALIAEKMLQQVQVIVQKFIYGNNI